MFNSYFRTKLFVEELQCLLKDVGCQGIEIYTRVKFHLPQCFSLSCSDMHIHVPFIAERLSTRQLIPQYGAKSQLEFVCTCMYVYVCMYIYVYVCIYHMYVCIRHA